MAREIGVPDLILFTGDLAFGGKRDEYAEVDAVLTRILNWLHDACPDAPAPLLFAVPGNHDLARPTGRLKRECRILDVYGDGHDEDVKELRKEIWTKQQPELLVPLFEEYAAWQEACVLKPLRQAQHQGHRCRLVHASFFPGDLSAVIEKESFKLALVGLNSSWIRYTGGDFMGKLHIPIEQFHAALPADVPGDFLGECNAAFLLMHHPPNWLSPAAHRTFESAIYKPNRFTLCLFGHMHEGLSQVISTAGGKPRHFFQAPSLFGLEHYGTSEEKRAFGYAWGEVRADGGLRIWPRKPCPKGDGTVPFERDPHFRYEGKNDWLWLREPRSLASGQEVTATASAKLGRMAASTAMPSFSIPTRPLRPRVPIGSPRFGLDDDEDLAQTPDGEAMVGVSAASPATMPNFVRTPARAPTWTDAVTGAGLWTHSRLPDRSSDRAESYLARARGLVAVCQDIWRQRREDLQHDPWLDSGFPVRVLERLDAFAGGLILPADQVLKLTVAPFVYQTLIVAAAQHLHTAEPTPAHLVNTTTGTEPRNTLEQVHRKYPALLRHANALKQGPERTAIVNWLVHRAIEYVPVVWNEKPVLPLARELTRRIHAMAGTHDGQDWASLVDLCRFVTIEPESLSPRHTNEGIPLAQLLHLASRMAFDPRDVTDLPVSEIGLGNSFNVNDLITAFSEAHWEVHGDIHVLTGICKEPVIDWALRNQVEQANAYLQQLRERWSGTSIGDGLLLNIREALPTYLSANGLEPVRGEDALPRYHLPHVNFKLANDRVRELLMGERLYNNPAVAIRELYQNALDACRYRKARQEAFNISDEGRHSPMTYVGRIEIEQDCDGSARTYIECRDNGVGMTEREIQQIFAVAGRRFVDATEFIEERAGWQARGIQFHPNSQFGIGVMSYFLLADEIRIRTRRFSRTTHLSDTCLEIRIVSVSGLFHMRPLSPGVLPEGGTEVRLYLRSDIKGASVYDLLGDILWFAEFDTYVREAERGELHWPAGKLAPGGQPMREEDFGSTGHPDIWWCHRLSNAGVHLLLADGIKTHSPEWAPGRINYALAQPFLCVINLRGEHFPRLSLDRSQTLQWDVAHFLAIMRKQATTLAAWPGLNLLYLWAACSMLDERIVQAVTEVLCQRDSSLRLLPHSEKWPDASIAMSACGFCPNDHRLFKPRGYMSKDALPGILDLSEDISLDCVPSFWAWRRAVLQCAVRPEGTLDGKDGPLPITWIHTAPDRRFARILEMQSFQPRAFDSLLLNLYVRVPLARLAWLANHHTLSLSDLLARLKNLAPLGIRLDPRCHAPETQTAPLFGQEDIDLLCEVKRDRDVECLVGRVSPVQILRIAQRVQRSPRAVITRLRELAQYCGLRLDCNEAQLDGVVINEWDWRLLSWGVYGSSPWLSGRIPALQLNYAAHQLKASVAAVMNRLHELSEPLQLTIDANAPLGTLEQLALDESETDWLRCWPERVPGLELIKRSVDYRGYWDSEMSSIQGMLERLNMKRLQRSWECIRLAEPLGLRLPRFTPLEIVESLRSWSGKPALLTDGGRRFVRDLFNSWGGRNLFLAASCLDLAHGERQALAWVIELIEPLEALPCSVIDALRQVDASTGPYPEINGALLRCMERAGGCGATYFHGELLAEARAWIYWLDDTQIQEQLAYLQPVVDLALRHADVSQEYDADLD